MYPVYTYLYVEKEFAVLGILDEKQDEDGCTCASLSGKIKKVLYLALHVLTKLLLHNLCRGSLITAYKKSPVHPHLHIDLASLSPSLVHQLTWGRTVNTHGGPGRNLPCDLHNAKYDGICSVTSSNASPPKSGASVVMLSCS